MSIIENTLIKLFSDRGFNYGILETETIVVGFVLLELFS